ncbi:MAG: hypothetical protein AAF493_11195 [Pseudomonadota bacterium]
MHVIILMLAAVIILAWLGFELKNTHREFSQIAFGISALFGLLLFGALFGFFGA